MTCSSIRAFRRPSRRHESACKSRERARLVELMGPARSLGSPKPGRICLPEESGRAAIIPAGQTFEAMVSYWNLSEEEAFFSVANL